MTVRPGAGQNRRPGGALRRLPAALSCGAAALLCGVPLQAAVTRQIPEQKFVRTEPAPRFMTYTYVPQTGVMKGAPVLFYSGDWGWTPLHQDAGSYLASTDRLVLGIDGAAYFSSFVSPEGLADDFTRFRAFANERAGRPKESPVILVGFASGAEIIPYLLNQVGAEGVLGAVLIAPDTKGTRVFRTSSRLDMDGPPAERFDVANELRRMAPIPVVLIEGSLDTDSAAKVLAKLPRGPHKYAPVVGGDRQFHDVRDTFFEVLSEALRWIDGTTAAPGGAVAAPPPKTPAAKPEATPPVE